MTNTERIEGLPKWAQQYIHDLRTQGIDSREHLVREVAQLRKRVNRLQTILDALDDIMRAAGRGGHETAQAYVDRILSDYGVEEENADGPAPGLAPAGGETEPE